MILYFILLILSDLFILSIHLFEMHLFKREKREKEERERDVFVKFRLKLHHLYAILSQNLYYFHND